MSNNLFSDDSPVVMALNEAVSNLVALLCIFSEVPVV